MPGPSGGSGAFDVSGAVAAGPLGGIEPHARPSQLGNSGDPHRGDLPYFAGNADGSGPGVPRAAPRARPRDPPAATARWRVPADLPVALRADLSVALPAVSGRRR